MKFRDQVIKGRGLGKKLGYPTANLSESHGILPGVYKVVVCFNDQKCYGLLVVGVFSRPDGLPAEEVYLLDFDKDIYGKTLEIELGEKLREIKKFTDDAELKQQIKYDIQCLRELLQSKGKWQE